ncbi:MAG TPA: hypothetical protein VKX16_08725 [Chloroflexota bacterium]|nr:hypothetical protein [Chloroflexota bacterium]
MTVHRLVRIARFVLATSVLCGALQTIGAQASSGPLPATLYPARTKITYFPTLSNAQVDCQWGFDCVGGSGPALDPLFHSLTQDELHRTGGWGQEGSVNARDRLLLFFLFVSQYDAGMGPDSVPWNVEAFRDLRLTTHEYGYLRLAPAPHLLAGVGTGGVITRYLHTGVYDTLLLACWTGSMDVEALALYDHGASKERALALRDLVRQVRAALR